MQIMLTFTSMILQFEHSHGHSQSDTPLSVYPGYQTRYLIKILYIFSYMNQLELIHPWLMGVHHHLYSFST